MKTLIKKIFFRLFPNKFILSAPMNGRNEIAITFDDGPHPVNTRELLKILRDEGIKATYFLSGSEIAKYPELTTAISNEGHEIGNHLFSHKKISETGMRAYREEMEKTSEHIIRSTGRETIYFRPPYGSLSLSLIWIILTGRYRCVLWSIDSKDSFIKNRNELTAYVKGKQVKSGDILLFHEDSPFTIEAIADLIQDMKARGLKPVTLSELMREAISPSTKA